MFGWRRRRELRRRGIFRYWDGVKFRYADPLTISYRISNDPEYDEDTTPRLILAGDPEAFQITLRAARRVFDVKEWTENQEGLTVVETAALFEQFYIFVGGLKKNTSSFATSQPSTEPATSPPSNEPTTSDTALSGTDETDPDSGKSIKSDPE